MLTFLRWPRPLLAFATLFAVFVVAAVDLLTGEELSFFVFYFIPVSFAAWNLNLRWAIATAILCTVAWLMVETLSGHAYSHWSLLMANTFIRLSSYTLIGYFVSSLKESRLALNQYAVRLEERVAQRTLTLQERVAELEMFSYSVSHNLRAPLRAMEGMAQAADESLAERRPEELRNYLDRIRSAAVRMDRLILDLVDYVQLTIGESQLRPISIGPLIFEVLAQYRSTLDQNGAKVTVESEMPTVWGHNRMLHAVFYNLVSNALKFSKAGQSPLVLITSQDLPDGRVQIRVRDHGIGIKKEHHERIFGLFEQLHPYDAYGGTGMGLALARKCVEKMDGRIGCESDLCQGSTFWIELRKYQQMGGTD